MHGSENRTRVPLRIHSGVDRSCGTAREQPRIRLSPVLARPQDSSQLGWCDRVLSSDGAVILCLLVVGWHVSRLGLSAPTQPAGFRSPLRVARAAVASLQKDAGGPSLVRTDAQTDARPRCQTGDGASRAGGHSVQERLFDSGLQR